MYQRKTFLVAVRTDGVSRGSVRLTKEDFVFNEKEVLEYSRANLIPSLGVSTIFINGRFAWQGKFNKSYANRIRNKRLDKAPKGGIMQI